MTAVVRSLLRRLTGPLGRRLLLVLIVAGAWLGWVYVPPSPLAAWDQPTDCSINDAVLAPDGMTFLARETPSAGQLDPARDSARLWHLPSGRTIVGITGLGGVWPDPHFAPDGSWIATQDRRGVITLRNTTDGRVRGELNPPDGRNPRSPAPARWRPSIVSPDGRVVACWAHSPAPSAVQLYHTTTGRPTVVPDGAADPIALSPDGHTLATGLLGHDDTASIALWDVDTGRAIDRFGDAAAGRPGAIAFSPDGSRLAAGLPLVDSKERWSHGVTVWDLATRRPVATLPVRAAWSSYRPMWHRQRSGLEFSPDGRFLVVRGGGYGLFWDLASDPPRCLDELLPINGDHSELGYLVFDHPLFTPDGSRFVVPGRTGRTLVIHDTATLAPREVLKVGAHGWRRPQSGLSPNGQWLAVACVDPSAPPSQFEVWLARKVGRQFLWSGGHAHLRVFNMTTGAEAGRVPTDGAVLGFDADSRSFWTYTQTPTTINYPKANPTTLQVRQWSEPTGRPPAWPLAATFAGLLFVIADWRRGRRRNSVEALP